MDIITRFWEKQANWMVKIDGLATFGAIIFVVIGFGTAEKGKPFGFILADIGFWLFGIAMIVALYHPDEQGISRVRRSGALSQSVTSIFYVIWFVLLTYITIVLYGAIKS